jgi:Cupin-like domain
VVASVTMPAIDRIPACAPDEFWRDYVLPRKPVILTDLVTELPYTTTESIVNALPDTELSDAHGAGLITLRAWWQTVQRSIAHDAVATAKLGELERLVSAGGYSSRHTSTDVRVPASFFDQAPRFRDFHSALLTPLDRDLHRAGLGPNGASSVMLFLGHPGVTTPCHVDGWVAQTFNTQLSGHKEWFLIAPERSAALGPCGFTYLVDPMRMTFRERTALAATIGGYSFVVAPGETLYFPHQWVHGTAYPEASFSFVQHFGRDLCSMFVSREVHRTFVRHAVMQQLYPIATVEGHYWTEFLAIHDACKRDYASPRDRFDAIDGTLRSLYEALFPDARVADLPFELELIRELEETKGAAWYAADGPMTHARNGWLKATHAPLFDWWT